MLFIILYLSHSPRLLLFAILPKVYVQIGVQAIVVQQLGRRLHRGRIRLLFVPQSPLSSVLSRSQHEHHVSVQHYLIFYSSFLPNSTFCCLFYFKRLSNPPLHHSKYLWLTSYLNYFYYYIFSRKTDHTVDHRIHRIDPSTKFTLAT